MRILRGLGYLAGGFTALTILAYAVVYLLSERKLASTHEIPEVAISIPKDAASIAEGKRLASIRGCFGGCHGRRAEGSVLFDVPVIGRIVAPNLTHAIPGLSDAEIAVAIRNGLYPDGRSMVVMPAEAFHGLTDEDLAKIIAFMRSLPEEPGPARQVTWGPLGRVGFAMGKFKPAATLVAEIRPLPEASSREGAFGQYLAVTICAQCHGTDLGGDSNPDFSSPPLQIVAAYSHEAFAQLLRAGKALGDRELGMMSGWSRNNLSFLTDEEITALFTYLHDLPATIRD